MLKIIKDTVAPRNKHVIWLNLNNLLFMIWIKTKWVSVGTVKPLEIDSDTLEKLLNEIKNWVRNNYVSTEVLSDLVKITEDLEISGHKIFTSPITANDVFINNKIRFNKDNLRPYIGLNDDELSIKSDGALKLEADKNINLKANNKVNITSDDSNINLGDGNIDFYSPSFIFSSPRNPDKSIIKIDHSAIVTNTSININDSKTLSVGNTVIRDDIINTNSISLEKIYTPDNKHLSITSTGQLKLQTSSNNSIAIQEDKNRINLVSPEIRWVLKILQPDGSYIDKEYLLSELFERLESTKKSILFNKPLPYTFSVIGNYYSIQDCFYIPEECYADTLTISVDGYIYLIPVYGINQSSFKPDIGMEISLTYKTILIGNEKVYAPTGFYGEGMDGLHTINFINVHTKEL